MSMKTVQTDVNEFVELLIKGLKDKGLLKDIKEAAMPQLIALLTGLYNDIVNMEAQPIHGWDKYLRVFRNFIKAVAKTGWKTLKNFAPALIQVAVAIVFKGKWDWLVDIIFPGLLKTPTKAVTPKAAATKAEE